MENVQDRWSFQLALHRPEGIVSLTSWWRPLLGRLISLIRGRAPQAKRESFLRDLPKGGICAEIGVWRGDFAEQMLRIVQPKQLHLVDPWEFMPSEPLRWYGGALAKSQANMDDIALAVQTRFRDDPRVTIHRVSSMAFFSDRNEPLDLVYIDGDHSFEAVYADLHGAWPLIRPGGILGGDDYHLVQKGRQAVREAADQFSAEVGIRVVVNYGQFIFKKPLHED